MKTLLLTLLCVTVVGCNAASPSALDDFNPALLQGKWSFVFTSAICTVPDIEASFSHFRPAGAIPASIRLIGSWQVRGEPAAFDLEGTLGRDTGEIYLELTPGSKSMQGLVLDNDNLALVYTDTSVGCSARAAALRIE